MLGGNLRIECVHFESYFGIGISHHIIRFASEILPGFISLPWVVLEVFVADDGQFPFPVSGFGVALAYE